MAYDPYAPCPCGSGKKLKFCCHAIADDMERIHRLIENGQARAALQQLEILDRRQPNNEWVTTTRALVLLEMDESAAARDLLSTWVASHPDSEFAVCLYAAAQLDSDGLDAAKKAIQRAFQKGAKSYPQMISGLATTAAAIMEDRGEWMSAREYLTLALRFAPESDRQAIFTDLVEFDSDGDVLYPMRSIHPLPNIPVPAEFEKEYKKGTKLSSIGCWDAAANVFAALADKLPDQPELLRAAGLCCAWDGDGRRAAELLHQAAAKLSDFSTAVEAEVLAQLLDLTHTLEKVSQLATRGDVASASRLLSALDEHPRLARQAVSVEPDAVNAVVARYDVLDRPALTERDIPTLTCDAVPYVIGRVVILEERDGRPAQALIDGRAGAPFEQTLELVKEIAGDQISWHSEPPVAISEAPRDFENLFWQWSFPPSTPLNVFRKLRREQLQDRVYNQWPVRPLETLKGKSPAEAAQDPSMRVAATAAVYVLDAACSRLRHRLDLSRIFQSLNLEPLPPLTLPADASPNALSLMQLHRLDVSSLTDEQLASVLNRSLLIRYENFLKKVLTETVRRPHIVKHEGLERCFDALCDICALDGDAAEALRWIEEGRQKLGGERPSFNQLWTWDLRELLVRLGEAPDESLRRLVDKFQNYYVRKVPQIQGMIERLLEEHGLDPSRYRGGIVTPDMVGSHATSGGLWSPQQEEAPAGAGKLWLPGQ
jgi:tetratricopeptide (TPR) repeat protein